MCLGMNISSTSAGGVHFRSKHQPPLNYDMALSSGIYTIRNVKHRNWAMLLDGNDEGEVVAGSSDTPDVGEKVSP